MINPKNIISSPAGEHIWHFSRVGGVNRVNLESGKDLLNLEHLDQKLWTALSCPVYGLEIDPGTLELVDADKDGRIRVPEIIAAVKWATSYIKNPDDLLKQESALPLSAINDSTPEGKELLESARQILKNIGKPDAATLTVADTSDTVKIFADTIFNGDGIITEASAAEEPLKNLINEIISCQGSATDRNGKEGISEAHINDFYKNCEDHSYWFAKAEADLKNLMPLGASTGEALASYLAIKAKVEDYFIRCKLAEFDPGSSDVLASMRSRYEEIGPKDLSGLRTDIAAFPLATLGKDKTLSLVSGINPSWEKQVSAFNEKVVSILFPGKDRLTVDDIEIINNTFSGYIGWQAEKAGANVEKLGLIRIREILKGNGKEQLTGLIAQDKALESNANNILMVDKLVRFYRDLYKLLRNYVTFYDFYSPDDVAIFQAGRLFIDQRCCDLCLRIEDMTKHNTLARTSGLCLIYCDCRSRSGKDRMTIVAALTDGDFDNIDTGRNGIFYDRKGQDYDATIIKIIDNPISIRQAFWSPYRKVSRFISGQVEKMAAAKDKEVTSMATSGVEKATDKIDSGIRESMTTSKPATPPPAAVPFDIGKFVGIFAALSLALGAIGSAVATIMTGFLKLSWWQMPLAILGLMLVISGPAMIIAWLKLRKRNLAPLLDANGWAINARATINIIFGNTLTHMAHLPENARLDLVDPFSRKKRPVIPILIIVIIVVCVAAYLLWHFGQLSKWGILGGS